MANISNSTSNTLVVGTSEDDRIYNIASFVTIDGDVGNDYIDSIDVVISYSNTTIISNDNLIIGADGNDTINNWNSNSTIDGGDGNDIIYNRGRNVTIDAGAGNDSIWNLGDSATINGGAGNDTIENHVDSVTINGEDGDDYLRNGKIFDGSYYIQAGNNVSMVGGAGNDTITNEYTVNGTLDGGDNVSMVGGAGNDSITNRGDYVTIDGGVGNDSIHNYGANSIIDGGDGDDFILNNHVNDTIVSNASGEYTISGNNSIGGNNSTINGGDGDDTIANGSSNVSINGGDGNDSLYGGTGENITIGGGAGNDTISSCGTIVYTEGDGHDIIMYYDSDFNSLQINSSVGWSSVISGNNIVITVGDGSITLLNAATSSGVNINGVTYPIDTTATVPAAVDTATIPAVVDTATIPAAVDTSTIPAVVDTATIPAVVDTSTIPAVAPTPVVPPVNPAVPTDVVFIIDNTGSMSDEISAVKNAIISFANTLSNSGAGYRLGLVSFGDLGDSNINVYGFTDRDTFIEWVDGISLTSGGDLPESGLEAVTAATTMPFMPGNNKRFIVVTDADFHNLGESGDGNPSTYYQTEAVQGLLAANAVKMDVVGTVGDNCQYEWEPMANATGGKFYDINNLEGGEVLQEIADDILGRSHVNINLNTDTVPEGTIGGVFVVTPVLNALGAVVPASSDATFKAAAEEGDFVVGYVVAPNAYMAVPDSPWRQIVTIPENWVVSGTWQDDALNITGSNVVVSGSVGKDNISINEGAININLVDVTELQNGSDTLSFSKKITPGTLQQIFTGTGVALYTTNEAGELDFSINLPGIVALDESLLNCEVSNAGTPNTIRELIYGEVNLPLFGGQDLSGRIMFAQWGYGFTPPEGNPLFTDTSLVTSADLAADFGSPTLDDISPANFVATTDDIFTQNFNALNQKGTETILASNKSKF